MSAEPICPLDQSTFDTHGEDVEREPSAADHRGSDTHTSHVSGTLSPTESTAATTPTLVPLRLADSLLLIFADALDDLERTRIATENRVRSLRQAKGMEGSPEELRLLGMVDAIKALEHQAELDLRRALRQHPLGPWVKRTVGIGEKQGARLLAAIGDPASRHTVSQLWAYCGYHVLNPGHKESGHQNARAGVHLLGSDHLLRDDQPPPVGADISSNASHRGNDTQSAPAGVAPSRKRGQKANWNSTAKMRAFLVAESCIKQSSSPYRTVYDDGRAKYSESVHQHECVRCGPSGKPAEVGSPLSAGHQHARALRLVAKAVIRDIWIESRRLHVTSDIHIGREAAGS